MRRPSILAAAGLIGLGCCVLLAACSQTPVAPAKAPSLGPGGDVFEQQQRTRAADLTKQGQLGEAAIVWEVLLLLRPDSEEYADGLRRTRASMAERVTQRLELAERARKRGESELASRYFLQVLADEPLNVPAADALRAMERDRNKRNFLGKSSAQTLTRSVMAEAEQLRLVPAVARRDDLKQAATLINQSAYAEAVPILERYVKVFPKDAGARKMLSQACANWQKVSVRENEKRPDEFCRDR